MRRYSPIQYGERRRIARVLLFPFDLQNCWKLVAGDNIRAMQPIPDSTAHEQGIGDARLMSFSFRVRPPLTESFSDPFRFGSLAQRQ